MEEMQWMRTRPISAANFFHGTLEVIERDIPVILIKGEDKTRPEMDRVEKFVNTISANVTVFDSKDFELKGISEEFRGMLCPIVMRLSLIHISLILGMLDNVLGLKGVNSNLQLMVKGFLIIIAVFMQADKVSD